MDAVLDVGRAGTNGRRQAAAATPLRAAPRFAVVASVPTMAALTSERADVNAVKHAGPSAINLVVRACGGTITIEVNDDGVGIDSSDASHALQAGDVGLAIVRRRVEDTGGRFEIETRADGGTRSRTVLPIREAA